MDLEKLTISQLKAREDQLTEWYWIHKDPEVEKAIASFTERVRPELEAIRAELKNRRDSRKPVQRWPEDTPPEVLEQCQRFWRGTEEFYKFRIHCWDDQYIWTGYPSGGYTNVGGYVQTPPAYDLIKRKETGGNIWDGDVVVFRFVNPAYLKRKVTREFLTQKLKAFREHGLTALIDLKDK